MISIYHSQCSLQNLKTLEIYFGNITALEMMKKDDFLFKDLTHNLHNKCFVFFLITELFRLSQAQYSVFEIESQKSFQSLRASRGEMPIK